MKFFTRKDLKDLILSAMFAKADRAAKAKRLAGATRPSLITQPWIKRNSAFGSTGAYNAIARWLFDRAKYLPHQGPKEMARRKLQLEQGKIHNYCKETNYLPLYRDYI